ncbi:MAG: substrate-binding domain-containing protein [Gemmatimonadetes bacterium]|nr:substrate-binding domain-containing protein [Gemmatimonadota bacterium]
MSVTGRPSIGVALLLVILPLGLLSLSGVATAQQRRIPRDLVLATTTSVRDAGLLDELLPSFERAAARRVKVVAVGSGQAIELGRRGEADLLIVHDPEREREFMASGLGSERVPLMHNEFVVLGPRDDPAAIRRVARVADAFRAIAAARARFVSRGDRSGTHAKETAVWAAAGVTPGNEWYRESGQAMGQTLQIASELGAYTLSDIGTFLAHKAPLELEILVEGDTVLLNPYHILVPNPDRFPWVDIQGAMKLRDFLLAAGTQRRIGAFGKPEYGRSLFVPEVR